ncbi:MAG: 3-demethylubiquinone-9 3-methyltransferase [Planctomycetota bacterium]
MKTSDNWLLKELIQPDSGFPLQLSDDHSQLLTPGRQTIARMVNDIPRFIDDQHLASFGLQWNEFDVAHEAEDLATFAAKTGVHSHELRGLRILDAGCGGGRYARICGQSGAFVVAADHSRAVDKAAQLCDGLPNVRFLQADLKTLPLKPASFDLVFSIGVMHHDADTRAVFDAVARMVRPGGRYSVWLYRRNQWWQEAINSALRTITTRLPHPILKPLCHLGALLGAVPVLNQILNKFISFSAHPSWQNRVCDTFDWYAPVYQHHHTPDELRRWFAEAGFEHITELPPEKTGRLYRWAWQQNLLPGSGVNFTGIRRSEQPH